MWAFSMDVSMNVKKRDFFEFQFGCLVDRLRYSWVQQFLPQSIEAYEPAKEHENQNSSLIFTIDWTRPDEVYVY